jgi:hypothetical protein
MFLFAHNINIMMKFLASCQPKSHIFGILAAKIPHPVSHIYLDDNTQKLSVSREYPKNQSKA